jgi:hypothetical protein
MRRADHQRVQLFAIATLELVDLACPTDHEVGRHGTADWKKAPDLLSRHDKPGYHLTHLVLSASKSEHTRRNGSSP